MKTARRKPAWRSAGIHTASELTRKSRRFGQHSLRVEQVLVEMRDGAALQLSFAPRQNWRLSTGQFVTDQVARTVINLPNVVGVGDTLFAGELSQTFRFTDVTGETP